MARMEKKYIADLVNKLLRREIEKDMQCREKLKQLSLEVTQTLKYREEVTGELEWHVVLWRLKSFFC